MTSVGWSKAYSLGQHDSGERGEDAAMLQSSADSFVLFGEKLRHGDKVHVKMVNSSARTISLPRARSWCEWNGSSEVPLVADHCGTSSDVRSRKTSSRTTSVTSS